MRFSYKNYTKIIYTILIILSLTRLANLETFASLTCIINEISTFDLYFALRSKYNSSSGVKLHNSRNLFNSGTVKL